MHCDWQNPNYEIHIVFDGTRDRNGMAIYEYLDFFFVVITSTLFIPACETKCTLSIFCYFPQHGSFGQ